MRHHLDAADLSLLVFQSPEPREIRNESPWIDFRVAPLEAVMAGIEAQTHRRFLKTHLEFDALPVYDSVRYIHVARDGRDAFLSWYNHSRHYTANAREVQSAAGLTDETIGKPLPIPEESIRDFFQVWMTDGAAARLANDFPAQRYFDIEKSYWAGRHQPNLLMVHYNDLLADLGGEMRRIASFLNINVPEATWPARMNAASFRFMREHGATLLPSAAMSWDKGADRFLNQGINGRWRDVLTPDDVALYETRVAASFRSISRDGFNADRASRAIRAACRIDEREASNAA